MRAILVLEDGTVFEGESLGAPGHACGEVVFNTGMTGYQEILTDPSYAGQIVTLTYPLVGNYGINADDFESCRVQVEGFIVREAADVPSNWRALQSLHQFLKERQVVGIKGVDTRALTRRLRVRGVMMGTISTEETPEQALARLRTLPGYEGIDFARRVTTEAPYRWVPGARAPIPVGEQEDVPRSPDVRFRVALIDCGVKYNILRNLAALGCETTVYPCTVSAAEILRDNPDGVMLSPGPGDPSQLGYVVDTVRRLVGHKPIMGVCLGNQIVGYAFGARTYKLKFGHRGSNHPVKDLETGRVYITSQNHGYAVDPDGLRDGMEVAHINLNDGTVEGLQHRELPIFTIQYHPEASPGPTDSRYFFSKFVQNMERARR
ncbi:MAG: glutamine-hydrolyzing carbamoyl-phosphate synthase small subunit [Chloroherpetonaceae bacterium]|nr:glutamine-hydrolyzing carbamoyl-phosphate synthase small subunit [Chthonomonadaceae bacterium]MDW8207026.1 glutamine-hydrolyzing carbamoyl-phosphate synthase small subunit [Chloroherpetonaceae bacterium]